MATTRIVAIIFICLLTAKANAQTVNKNLLYGKWTITSLKADGQEINADNLTTAVDYDLKLQRQNNPDHAITREDSLKAVADQKKLYKDLSDSYIDFGQKGNVTTYIAMKKDKNDNPLDPQAATYTWTGEKTLSIKEPGRAPSIVTIEELTAKTLKITLKDEFNTQGPGLIEIHLTKSSK